MLFIKCNFKSKFCNIYKYAIKNIIQYITNLPIIEWKAYKFSFFETSFFTVFFPLCSYYSSYIETS